MGKFLGRLLRFDYSAGARSDAPANVNYSSSAFSGRSFCDSFCIVFSGGDAGGEVRRRFVYLCRSQSGAAHCSRRRVHAAPTPLVVPGTEKRVCLVLRRAALLGATDESDFVPDGGARGMRSVLSGLNQPLRWACRMPSAMFRTVSSKMLERWLPGVKSAGAKKSTRC